MIHKPSDHIKTKFDKIGILLINLGTPENTDYWSMRKYLKQFLSDRRVIDVFKPLWWLILNGIVLRTRPAKSAKAYQSVWTDEGSPLLLYTKKQKNLIKEKLEKKYWIKKVIPVKASRVVLCRPIFWEQ